MTESDPKKSKTTLEEAIARHARYYMDKERKGSLKPADMEHIMLIRHRIRTGEIKIMKIVNGVDRKTDD